MAYLKIKSKAMHIEVRVVKTKADIKNFIQFQHDLYRDDEYYVPELYVSQREMFDRNKFPFYAYGDAIHYLAYQGETIVGRISAVSNPRYNSFHNSNVGFFGFFDFIDSEKVARVLLEKASDWLRSFGYDRVIGPTNFTTNETAGFLVSGFDASPFVMMTYNFPYYIPILEKLGLKKEMDLLAYMIHADKVSEKSIRLSAMIQDRLKRQDIRIRKMNIHAFEEEVLKVQEIYNSAWDKNWGFVPFTEAEFQHLAKGLKMLIDEDFAYIAEHRGKAIGFSISIPNINEITKAFKNGKLLPFNLLTLLFRKKKTKFVRILAMGVIEGYRKKGIEALFFAKNIQEAKKRNILGGEASWILESNNEMRQGAEKLNGEMYKTYRLFSHDL